MRTCPWCKDAFELAEKGGHLACPECRSFLVRKGEPGWDEGFASRVGRDEYWISYYYGGTFPPEALVQIQAAQKPDPA
jgi:uncharacterized protein YbaR (Trm112 family)